MSIEGKHAYRFGYLKSEQWQNVRIQALGRENGKCQICSEESIYNDAHHIWYPENIYETKEFNLVILCRPCHNFLHIILPECKTNDKEKGEADWCKFSQAMTVWRFQKSFLFEGGDIIDLSKMAGGPKELRARLSEVMTALAKANKILFNRGLISDLGVNVSKKSIGKTFELDEVLVLIRKWALSYNAKSVDSSVADSDFQI